MDDFSMTGTTGAEKKTDHAIAIGLAIFK